MSRPTCAGSDLEKHCERAVVRFRDGQGFCLYHPHSEPPALDPKTGRPISATPPPKKAAAARKPAPYRAPGRVIVATQTDAEPPVDGFCPHCQGDPRPFRHQGRHTQPARPVEPPPVDGLCLVPDCPRPYKHTGSHTRPKPAREPRTPRPARPVEPAPTDGLCRVQHCRKPYKHKGAHHKHVDPAEAARRYLEGEGLFSLAPALGIGAARLREILLEQGVTIRKRGEVVGLRGPAPRPIDADLCRRLYEQDGLNTAQIARQLQVKSNRVQDLLRELGVLRPPGGRHPGAGALNSVRLKLGPDESRAVRIRAAELGVPINAYLRRLVLTDLGRDVQRAAS